MIAGAILRRALIARTRKSLSDDVRNLDIAGEESSGFEERDGESTPHPSPLLGRGGEGEFFCGVFPRAALSESLAWAIIFRPFGAFCQRKRAKASVKSLR